MNSSDITIEDVNLQVEKSSRYIEGKVQVIITLKNSSKTLIYYVLKRPRNIDYDKGSRTLSIGLYEKELPQDIKVSFSRFEPEQVAILPDTTLQWQYLFPVWMKKITRPSGLREIVEVLNISDVQKVVCTVAYHTSPFRVKSSDGPEEVLVALSKWGETVSASFERKLTL
ncbi:hypothetical protein [Puia dinghuensis]|uniref:hypothetical protein n=1 Tax=Puia dinghuensis TaxID=1792502 RepID=UPI00166C1AD1|nr:hypothetical protein [Puia dinghuensis]